MASAFGRTADAMLGGPGLKPTLSAKFFHLPTKARLKAARQYIKSFQYKQSPETYFNRHKLRPLCRIMDTARMIVYDPKPIKCVEAVFLALYLTAGLTEVERIPLSFKTQCEGQVHQHIVLLLHYGGQYGALGISRRLDLMDKDITFDSISGIIRNYIEAYGHLQHDVLKVRVGLPVEHDLTSRSHVCWRSLCLDVGWMSWEECCEALEKHEMQGKRLWDKWLLEGKGGDPKRVNKAKKPALDTNVELVKKKPTVPELLDTALRLASSEHSLRLRFQVPGLDDMEESRFGENSQEALKAEEIDDLQVIFQHAKKPPSLSTFTFSVKGRKLIRSRFKIPLAMAAKPITFYSRKVARTFELLSSLKGMDRRPKRRVRQLG